MQRHEGLSDIEEGHLSDISQIFWEIVIVVLVEFLKKPIKHVKNYFSKNGRADRWSEQRAKNLCVQRNQLREEVVEQPAASEWSVVNPTVELLEERRADLRDERQSA